MLIAKYNEDFRAIMLKVCNLMSAQDLLLAYLRGLKHDIQQHVMLGNPSNVSAAM